MKKKEKSLCHLTTNSQRRDRPQWDSKPTGANINIGAEIAGTNTGIRGRCDIGNAIEGVSRDGVAVVGIANSEGNPRVFEPSDLTEKGTAISGSGTIGVKGLGVRAGVLGEGSHNNIDTLHGGVGVKGTSNFDDGVVGQCTISGKSGVFGLNTHLGSAAFGVFGACDAPAGAGVGAESALGNGVRGHSQGNDGVVGLSDANGRSGVFGFNANKEGIAFGVFGACHSAEGAGVSGRNDSGGDAVSGFSAQGVAVRGTSPANDAVVGHAEARGRSGIFRENTGNPDPRLGGSGLSTEVFGVTGRANAEAGIGVVGDSANGTGVSGNGGTYGAKLQGGRAPLRLVPFNSPGSSTTGFHLMGELYVDSEGNLFFCKSNGTPGTWVKLA